MENQDSVDQKNRQKYEKVRQWIRDHAVLLAKQGRVVEAWREYRGRKLGPYFRLAYREDGRQQSIYLGQSAQLAEQVRALLDDCQAAVHERRDWQRLCQHVWIEAKKNKDVWRHELAKVGLRLHGNEVRGWRSLSQQAKSSVMGPRATADSRKG